MLKKLLIGLLVAVIAVGAGTSVFTVLASKEPTALPAVVNVEPASEAAAYRLDFPLLCVSPLHQREATPPACAPE